jgi:hypothetical protein
VVDADDDVGVAAGDGSFGVGLLLLLLLDTVLDGDDDDWDDDDIILALLLPAQLLTIMGEPLLLAVVAVAV